MLFVPGCVYPGLLYPDSNGFSRGCDLGARGFGRIRSRVGFGWTPGPCIWNQPTQWISYYEPFSNIAFNVNVRRYHTVARDMEVGEYDPPTDQGLLLPPDAAEALAAAAGAHTRPRFG